MDTTLHPPAPLSAGRVWRRQFRALVTRRRSAISLVLFVSLIACDMFVLRVQPRNVLNLANPLVVLGELLVVAGLAIRSWSAGILFKNKRLMTDGPYSLVRNPLYFGSFLMMFGFVTLVHDLWSVWLIVGPIACVYLLQVRHEERNLADWFGQEWTDYTRRTPRFIPRSLRPTPAHWSAAQWLHNREWQALAASAIAMVGLYAWRTLAA